MQTRPKQAEFPQPLFDGDAHEYYVGAEQKPAHGARVFINPSISYPLEIGGSRNGYLTNIHTFKSPEELFVYLAAHELRHIWQYLHPRSIRKIRSLLRCNDETDADIYAMRILSRYRQQKVMALTQPRPKYKLR